MRPLRIMDPNAAPLDGRGRRTPRALLMMDERDALLIEAARFFPGASDREIARQLRTALSRYRDGRWRREQVEVRCPAQHEGKLTALLWCVLKVRDHVPSERLIRAVLASARYSLPTSSPILP